jgi:proteic killer suppression protein
MEVRFDDDDLARLEADARFSAGFQPSIVSAFRRRMQQIRAAQDERDLYAIRSLHFEKLKGQRQGEHSMRLNEKYRLICFLEGAGPANVLVVQAIEDYH